MDLDTDDNLLHAPTNVEYETLTRTPASYIPLRHFDLAKGEDKHYTQQYGDMYFLRLAKLKPAVEKIAVEAWEGYQIAGDTVHRVDRVLDVRQGELCWVAGTVYMDMPMKPNILDDISKDHWIAGPPPREKYISPNGQDKIMLEDESGRLRLIGVTLHAEMLVTGCIIAVMGTENANGDFDVIDLKVPDLPSQPERWDFGGKDAPSNGHAHSEEAKPGKVAIVSGLSITGESGDLLALDLLMEYLLGESSSPTLQASAAQVTRLIIAGNSLAEATPFPTRDDNLPTSGLPGSRKATTAKKYGYDSSAYNPAPTAHLDLLLSTLLPSIPVTLLPGASDPANVSLPQQPLHPALFTQSRAYAASPSPLPAPSKRPRHTPNTAPFHPTTNPTSFSLSGHLFLGTSGQPTDDIGKYTDPAPTLELMEHTLRWRLLAPTCPDTLWCYPFQSDEPFVLLDGQCPHVYFVGNQAAFATAVVEGDQGQRVRCVSVPRFAETGEVVLVDLETLEVEVVRFEVFGDGGG